MKLFFSLLVAGLAATCAKAEPTPRLRKDANRAAKEEAKPADRPVFSSSKEKYTQAMISVHGMSGHPTYADVAVIEKAVARAYNEAYPDAKWSMSDFHDTWAQIFEEPPEDDVMKAADGSLSNYNLNVWGAYGGYTGFECRNCRPDDDDRLSSVMTDLDVELLGDMLGNSLVSEELCRILRKSESDIFEHVHDCSVSCKPAALAVVEALRKQASDLVALST